MARLLALSLVCLLTLGCANPVLEVEPTTYTQSVSVGVVEIRDDGVQTSAEFKHMLVDILSRYPRAQTKLRTITLKGEPPAAYPKATKWIIAGMYNSYTYELTLWVGERDVEDLRDTYLHELGHAYWEALSDEEKHTFFQLFYVRLAEAGHKEALGSDWRKYPRLDGFPSQYAAKSLFEWFAEHFAERARDPEQHAEDFPLESELLKDADAQDPPPVVKDHTRVK